MNKSNKLLLCAVLMSASAMTLAQAQTQQKQKSYSSGFSSSKPTSKPQAPTVSKPTPAPSSAKKAQPDYSASGSYGSGSYSSRAAQQTSIAPRNTQVTAPTPDKYRYSAPAAVATPAAPSRAYYGQSQPVQVKQAAPIERKASAIPDSLQSNSQPATVAPTVPPRVEPPRLKGFAGGFGSSKPAPAENLQPATRSSLNRDLNAATASANALRTLDARKAAAATAAVTAAGAVGYVATRDNEQQDDAQSHAPVKAHEQQRTERYSDNTSGHAREYPSERNHEPIEVRRPSQPVIVHRNDNASDWLSGYAAGQATNRQSHDRVVVVNPARTQNTPIVEQSPTIAAATTEKSSSGSGWAIFLFLLALAALGGAIYYFVTRASKKTADAPRRNYTIN
jgi:hypothetical protein